MSSGKYQSVQLSCWPISIVSSGYEDEETNEMIRKQSIAIIVFIVALVASYIYTAPYAGNAGLSRMPGVRIGGTHTCLLYTSPSPRDVEESGEAGWG